PDAEMVEAELLVFMLLGQQCDIDDAVGQVDAAARVAGALETQGLLVELRGLFGVGNDDGNVANSVGHESTFPCRFLPCCFLPGRAGPPWRRSWLATPK